MKQCKTKVLVEGGGVRAFIYEYPCGTLSYNPNRKRFNWVVQYESGLRFECKEDYKMACDLALEANTHGTIRAHILLEHDGRFTHHTAAQHFRRLSREWFK